ncbi:MAG: TSUP family transporter [Melioribacter sp.]|nr:TSUP family transporter [Melioribacter sp.]
MEYIIIGLVSLFVSGLTFFSGFGLGTLLMPVFAIFSPIEIAIDATAIVHLANNIFKVILVGKNANKIVTLKFAIPAIAFAFLGAWLLIVFSHIPPLIEYSIFGKYSKVTPIKAIIALLLIIFSLIEILPFLTKLQLDKKYIPFGGALSGFFGGLSSHQGALRTAFLIKAGLEKQSLIGTMVVSAVLVDVARLSIYGITFLDSDFSLTARTDLLLLVIIGCLSAFIGSYFGKFLFEKVTYKSIQLTVEISLLIFAVALGSGII